MNEKGTYREREREISHFSKKHLLQTTTNVSCVLRPVSPALLIRLLII